MQVKKHAEPVLLDQSGRLMAIDPFGINASPEEVRRKFNTSRDEVVRRRAYEIWEQRAREHGRALEHWLQAEYELG